MAPRNTMWPRTWLRRERDEKDEDYKMGCVCGYTRPSIKQYLCVTQTDRWKKAQAWYIRRQASGDEWRAVHFGGRIGVSVGAAETDRRSKGRRDARFTRNARPKQIDIHTNICGPSHNETTKTPPPALRSTLCCDLFVILDGCVRVCPVIVANDINTDIYKYK